ncbi:hypothetical protein [Fructobacillus parabroussonetiae]|uniref:Lipoprotein n=1 Tax=Fructobacillus parabroussonetiae TaxID=2713174 RepID=A0ABS5QW93_9LACO|nr:hypothetical protein [Fructobacillus parabroussonetiae]MBS9337067.1 hypothetical protein [Fructobacillus parabroussonetiae]
MMKSIQAKWLLALIVLVGLGAGAYVMQKQHRENQQEESPVSSVTSRPSKNNALSLTEAQMLIQKVNGEWPSDNQKILSQSGNKTVVGGGVGAQGYDKITYTVEGQQVHIHEEFGTLDGGKYSVLDYMPAKDYTVDR